MHVIRRSKKNSPDHLEPTLNYIGIIHSPLRNLDQCPLLEHENAPAATIEVFAPYTTGIKNIQEGDKIILFTWLHMADRTVLKTRPRNNPHSELTGVFSTRSPDRPNPIGIHLVKVIAVLPGNNLQVGGLEVLDQTPLIDIKPSLKG